MGPVAATLTRIAPGARRGFARLAGVGVLAGIVALAQALSVAWVITAVVGEDPLRTPLTVLTTILVLRGLVAALDEIVARHAGHAVSGEVRSRLLLRWLSSPPDQRPDHDAAIGLAGVGVNSLEPYVAQYLPALVTAVVVPALTMIVLLWVDPWSSLILLLTLPLLPLFAALIGKHTEQETARRWEAMHTLAGHFLDVVRGLPTLVAYGRAQHQVETVAAVGDRHRRASVQTLRTAFLSSAALELLATISVAMVAVAVGLRLAYGRMDLQVGLAAILLAPEAYWPIRRVGQEFHNAADGAAVLARLASYLDHGPMSGGGDEATGDGDEDVHADPSGQEFSPVAIEGVFFGYPERPRVLDDLSLHTPPGPGMTVLTGPSGSGKSTLLDLLAGVRTPSSGIVVARPAHLATQRPVILPGSVLDALRLGAPAASESECRDALQAVGLWSALREREGLTTRLGDDGVGLSAGQRTRLALARALLSRTSLVLLDEPTAHVDIDDLDSLRDLVTDLATTRRVIVATHDDALVARGDSWWDLPRKVPKDLLGPSGSPGTDAPVPTTVRGHQPNRPSIPVAPGLSWWQELTVSSRLALAWVLGGMSMASGVALTATSGWLIVAAAAQPVVLTLIVAIVGVRAFGIARPVLRYAERVVSHDAALETLASRRVDLFRRLIPLTPARLGRHHRGDLLTAVVTDLDDAVDNQVRVLVPWFSTVVASLSAVLILLVMLPWAAVVMAAGAIAAFGVARVGSRAERAAQDDAIRARGEVLGVTTDLVDRLDQIRALIGADSEISESLVGRIDQAHRFQGVSEARLIRARAITLAVLWAVLAATTVGVTAVAAAGFATALVSAPVAALIALTPIALAEAWVGLAEIGGAGARSHQAEARLARVLDQRPGVSDEGTLSMPGGVLPVTAEAIRAAWTDDQVPLGPFSLPSLDPGVRAQVTGPNGIGKSTLLAVLATHLSPVSGIHLLAGVPAADVALADARRDIAIVDEEPHAFAGSIRANLTLASPDATDDCLLDSLAAADLTHWMDQQPNGLDTQLAGLSGGERTRLAIARAVLSGRRLVLLDEPIAHLDDGTAARALATLMADPARAIVTVSHQPLPTVGEHPETLLQAAAEPG